MGAVSSSDREECTDASVYEALTAYAFDDLEVSEREHVALHLVECDACWRELVRLEQCIGALRHDPRLRPISRTPEMFAMLGLAGQLEQRFGGHGRFVALTASLYGLLYVASVWTELAYSYDRFGRLAWLLSPLVLLWAGGALLLALAVDASVTTNRRFPGVAWSVVAALASLGALLGFLSYALPGVPTIDATFQTRSAAGGYLKNALYYFLPLLIFILPTFHAVLGFQRELRAGRHHAMLDFLSGSPTGVAPRGVWFVPMWLLAVILMVAVPIGYQGTSNMLDNLKLGPYADLFSAALYVRVALWFVIAVVCMAWYQRRLDDLKREALLVSRLVSEPRN